MPSKKATYCDNKATVITGEYFYSPLQDLLLPWRKAAEIISISLVAYRLKLHGICVTLLQSPNNQSINKHFLHIFPCATHCDRLGFVFTELKKKWLDFFFSLILGVFTSYLGRQDSQTLKDTKEGRTLTAILLVQTINRIQVQRRGI